MALFSDPYSGESSPITSPGVGVSRAPLSSPLPASPVSPNLISGFYINLPIGGVSAIFLAAITIPEQTPKSPISIPFLRSVLPRFDLVGFALFAPASIMLLLALQLSASDYAWDSSEVIGLFCGAGATALVFVYWEYRTGDDAMIPFSMVRRRVIWASCLNFALLMTMLVVGNSFMPIYLQSVKWLSPTMSGVYLLASILSQLLFVIVCGALSKISTSFTFS